MKNSVTLTFDNCFDGELFKDKSQITEIMCPINFGVLNDPVSLTCCGNVFCKKCIAEWLAKKNACPCCRNEVDTPIGQPILIIRNSINRKEVVCKNKAKGCEWEGQLEKLFDHFRNSCGYHEVSCEYCEVVCFMKDLSEHQKQCLKRPIICERCEKKYLFSETKAHEEVCEELEINCTECDAKIARKCRSSHLENDCPEMTVTCSAKNCTKTIKRKIIDRHCVEEHSEYMMKIVFKEFPRILSLVEKQQAMLEAMNAKIQQLEDKMQENFKTFLKVEDVIMIKNWISPNTVSLVQLFKSSIHGESVEKFHSICDNRGPTLTVVKTDKDYILGGFTNVSWSSEGKEKALYDPAAFLFSINLKRKFEPLKTQKKENVYLSRKFGPSFYWSLLIWRDGNASDNLLGYQHYNSFNLSPYEENAGQSLIGNCGTGYISFNSVELEVYGVDIKK